MAGSEGYAIKLRDRRKNLALAGDALARMEAGTSTSFDRQRYGSLAKLTAHVDRERRCIAIMDTY